MPRPLVTGEGAASVPELKAVIFDYGHTFLNFAAAEENLLACYQEVREILLAEAQHELPEASEMFVALSRRVDAVVQESYKRAELDELDIVALYDNALGALGVHLPKRMVRDIVEMEHRALARDLAVPAENLDVLDQLRAMGLKIGLVSNAHFLAEMMRADIERLGIARYIDDAVFSAEIGVRKPHPAIFNKVLNALGVQPGAALFVGDRMHDDISGAKALGMKAVLTRQFRQEDPESKATRPDHVIERLPDLIPYVKVLMGEAPAVPAP